MEKGLMRKNFHMYLNDFTREKKGAFGIGLSVVWSGMDYLGGRVEIENLESPLHGAVYRLYFPLS
mgnify:CR=1 FL=1